MLCAVKTQLNLKSYLLLARDKCGKTVCDRTVSNTDNEVLKRTIEKIKKAKLSKREI